jgi:glycosyltransferase involved in cell wall biosynthesis
MRILVVSTWWPYPPTNGSRLRAFHLVQALARRHAITLLAFGPEGGAAEGDRAEPAGVRSVRVPRSGAGRRSLVGLLNPVPRHFLEIDSDVMRAHVRREAQGQDCVLALQIEAARYAAEVSEVPRIFDEVELTVYRERVERGGPIPVRARHGLTWLKHRSFARRLINRFDAATCVSDLERAGVAAIGVDPTRLHVVPNGVSIVPGPHGRRVETQLVYPGSVRFSANLDAVRVLVREILPAVRAERPDVTLLVTGDTTGVDLSGLQAPGVTFTGEVHDIERVVATSAVCVVPLRIGGGTRLKVLQAMAVGTPVVSTPKGVEGLALEPGRDVEIADSPEALSRRVVHLLADPQRAAALTTQAMATVRARYTWDTAADAIERAIAAGVSHHRVREGSVSRRVNSGI